MIFRSSRARATALVAAVVVLPVSLLAGAPVQAATGSDTTTPAQARLVDRVPTPKIGWYNCYGVAQCAMVALPLDYDQPKGPSTKVAVLRIKARKPKQRIGSLFVNPGGPGGSGVGIAQAAPDFLPAAVLDRFDIVGFDPRGTNFSDNVRCFKNIGVQDDTLAGLSISFPYTKAEEKAAVSSAAKFGKACSSTGQPLAGSMSTAEVARDMDVLRRAVGDKKLTYLGFSYGTYLGQVYANMFPDRVRALVIDGVLDPVGWAGTSATAGQPQTDRIRSADGAYRALKELFVRCAKAGEEACPLLTRGDPAALFDKLAKRLQAHPLVMEDESGTSTFSYADFVGESLGELYSPDSAEFITQDVSDLLDLTDPTPPGAAAKAARTKALRAFIAKRRAASKAGKANGPHAFDFAYYNDFEAFASVLCSDGLNPADASAWPTWAPKADARAKYFGRAWLWGSAQCASHTWTARDEDAYRGPFNRRTAAPVLVIGSYWDPATFYDNAKQVSTLLPNSRLLSSDNWGHTAFGTSDCATNSTADYLVRLTLPKVGTVCHGDVQPYEHPVGPASLRSAKVGKGGQAPIVPLVPGGPKR